MEHKISQEELNTLIAKEIREKGLNDILKLDSIKEKVYGKIKETQGNPSEEMNEMQNPAVANGPTEFPRPDQQVQIPTEQIHLNKSNDPQTIEPKPAPEMVPVSELPDVLKYREPEKLIIFDYNELSVGGENLSIKPFKTLQNPDEKKSMNQLWIEKGLTKAEVYQAKFEKIGEIQYDYKSGLSSFIANKTAPAFENEKTYAGNPYMEQPNIQLVNKEVENYIKTSVDIKQVIADIVTDIVKDHFVTNSEMAINNTLPTGSANITKSEQKNENVVMLKDLIATDSEFIKIDTPIEINEAIDGKSKKAKLVFEDTEIKKWLLGEKEYFFPANPLSYRKCYVKM